MGMRAVSNPRRGLCTSGLLSQESFNKVQRLFSLTCLKHPMASLGFKIKHPIFNPHRFVPRYIRYHSSYPNGDFLGAHQTTICPD